MVLRLIPPGVEKALIGLSCFLCFFVILVLWDLFRKRHILKFARNSRGYRFYPVIGSAYHTIGKGFHGFFNGRMISYVASLRRLTFREHVALFLKNVFTVMENAKKEHGLPCGVWNGHDYHYITADASEIKVVLNHPSMFDKGAIYDNFKRGLGKTLLLVKYNKWKRNRKIFSKSFSQSILNGFVDNFYEKACILGEILGNSHKMGVCEIFCRLTLDNFCANIMNLNLDIQRNRNNRFVQIMERLQAALAKRIFTSYFIPNILAAFGSPRGITLLKEYFEIKRFVYNIIQQKKETFKAERDFRKDSNKLTLLEMLLENEGQMFTDEEIFNEMLLFLLAATDTSGLTLCFTFTLLGMNPEAQEKVYQEVNEIVGLEGPISNYHLPDLKYTERVILESMRILPVTPMLERHVAADVDLGDKTVPAGANIMISVMNLHRSEAYWKNPIEFNPDRFLPEEVAQRHPYAFIPFSAGLRNCIGLKYAMMMMKTTVASVIRSYEVRSKHKSVTELKFESFITMQPIHHLDCTFIRRTNEDN